MKKEEIHWLDWDRILFGAAPVEFLLEVLIRTIIIYLVLLVILRLLGKRMSGQITIMEFSVMLTLGAIVSVAMQIPERGIMLSVVLLIAVLAFQRGYSYLTIKSKRFEALTQGTESLLVANGTINYQELQKMRISKEQLFAVMRAKQIYNLGEVQRVYLEACGLFSIFKFKKANPGLSLVPEGDRGAEATFNLMDNQKVCDECGLTAAHEAQTHRACENCGNNRWINATIAK
jgi:uncharacterized membrane protein YcaP (DUF421 family)